jgi:hypothetical protein
MNYQILFILIASFLAFYAVFLSAPNPEEGLPIDDSNLNANEENEETKEFFSNP